MFGFFRRKNKENKKIKPKDEKINEEMLNEILERIRDYKAHLEFYEGLSHDEVESKNENIAQRLQVKIPSDYKLLLQKSNGIYWYNGVEFLNIDGILKETSKFKEMMEDWEIGKIANPFLELVRYNDGYGFIFWYSELNKYVVVDELSCCELDDLNSLKTFDNICEVIEYLEIIFKEFLKSS